MNFSDFLDPLISRLKIQRKDKDAAPFFDLLSGAFVWSDERIHGLNVNEMGCLRAIFRYRTSLIVREADQRFEALWMELKAKYPLWIGFNPGRCSPDENLISRYRKAKKLPPL